MLNYLDFANNVTLTKTPNLTWAPFPKCEVRSWTNNLQEAFFLNNLVSKLCLSIPLSGTILFFTQHENNIMLFASKYSFS